MESRVAMCGGCKKLIHLNTKIHTPKVFYFPLRENKFWHGDCLKAEGSHREVELECHLCKAHIETEGRIAYIEGCMAYIGGKETYGNFCNSYCVATWSAGWRLGPKVPNGA